MRPISDDFIIVQPRLITNYSNRSKLYLGLVFVQKEPAMQ